MYLDFQKICFYLKLNNIYLNNYAEVVIALQDNRIDLY